MKEDHARRMYAVLCEHFGAPNKWRELDTDAKERWIKIFAKALSEIGPPPPYPPDPPAPPPKP